MLRVTTDFTNKKKTNRVVFLALHLYQTFLNTWTADETFQQSGRKTPSDTYWMVDLVYKKVQAHNSLEPPLRYNQDQAPLINECSLWPI